MSFVVLNYLSSPKKRASEIPPKKLLKNLKKVLTKVKSGDIITKLSASEG